MPIFEYLCAQCNRIYSFLSLSPAPKRQPSCPRCGASDLTRVPSAFAVAGTTRKAETKAEKPGEAEPEVPRGLEQELSQLADSLDERDMEDPRTMGRLMRRLAEASGEPMPPTLDEMIRRMEAGEDPEKLEEELGDQLEEELGGEDAEEGLETGPERDPGLYSL
ncbi:MAG: FmdB family zinc ribbon protein [Thermoanaerobaculum sp.]